MDEPADAQLAAVQEFHADIGQRSSSLRQALSDHAALAERLKERLAEVDEDFDVALITEAKERARALAAAPSAPRASEAVRPRNAACGRRDAARPPREARALVRKLR
ncbi:hypothetical protein AB3662_30085 [Sorangium cellulosum]|uniref:hypothetical protein n=1 Tax=Sorangium cellulosum TaxID=56 RepID=UPI003D9A47C1